LDHALKYCQFLWISFPQLTAGWMELDYLSALVFYNYISIVYSVMKKIENKKPDIIPDLTVDFKNLNG
jgi:hypothetical protein